MRRTVLAQFAVALLALMLVPSHAAACQANGANRVTITSPTSVTVTPSYNPYSGTDLIFSFSVAVNNPHNSKSCQFGLSFTRNPLPASMANGASALQYSVESSSGATLMQTVGFVFGSSPAASNRIDSFVNSNSSISLNVRVRIPAGQTSVTSGLHTDSTVTIGIYEINGGGAPVQIVDERIFPISATVISSCILPAPDIASHDFTTAITLGLPNAAVVRRSTFTGVACTQPARIRLSGSALQPTVAVGAAAGFDNTINWVATGVFGAANVTHQTASATATTSTGFNVTSGAVSGATITVDINLVAGNPIIAGSYTGILTISVDPNL